MPNGNREISGGVVRKLSGGRPMKDKNVKMAPDEDREAVENREAAENQETAEIARQ